MRNATKMGRAIPVDKKLTTFQEDGYATVNCGGIKNATGGLPLKPNVSLRAVKNSKGTP